MSSGAVGTSASLRESRYSEQYGFSEIPRSSRGRSTAPGTDQETLRQGIRRQGQSVPLTHPLDHADLVIHTSRAERNFAARGTV